MSEYCLRCAHELWLHRLPSLPLLFLLSEETDAKSSLLLQPSDEDTCERCYECSFALDVDETPE